MTYIMHTVRKHVTSNTFAAKKGCNELLVAVVELKNSETGQRIGGFAPVMSRKSFILQNNGDVVLTLMPLAFVVSMYCKVVVEGPEGARLWR